MTFALWSPAPTMTNAMETKSASTALAKFRTLTAASPMFATHGKLASTAAASPPRARMTTSAPAQQYAEAVSAWMVAPTTVTATWLQVNSA
jgi:hypothetical protein